MLAGGAQATGVAIEVGHGPALADDLDQAERGPGGADATDAGVVIGTGAVVVAAAADRHAGAVRGDLHTSGAPALLVLVEVALVVVRVQVGVHRAEHISAATVVGRGFEQAPPLPGQTIAKPSASLPIVSCWGARA